jgi:hypothetical protein
MQSEDVSEITKALVGLQHELAPVRRESKNPFLGTRYADLSACWEALREPLARHNLAVVQTTEPGADGHLLIVTELLHTSGQWIRGHLPIKPTKQDPQSLGSAITYGRRYALAAICGLVQEDDDAEGAMSRQSSQSQPPRQQPRDQGQKTQAQSRPQGQKGQQRSPQGQSSQSKPQQNEGQPQGQAQGQNNLATQAQQQKLNIQLEQAVGRDRNEKINYVNRLLQEQGLSDKQITSSRELTKKEASALIEHLQGQSAESNMDDLPF